MDADEDDVGFAEGGAVGVDAGTRSLRGTSSVSGTKVIKKTSSNCKQLELDLVLFIVHMGATGPPRYTLILKTKPDSLTNQGLPGLNTANICRFLTTDKFLPVFFILSTHLSDYMHCRYVLIHTKVMPHLYPST